MFRGKISHRRKQTCRSYGAVGKHPSACPTLQTCHSYGVYEECFILIRGFRHHRRRCRYLIPNTSDFTALQGTLSGAVAYPTPTVAYPTIMHSFDFTALLGNFVRGLQQILHSLCSISYNSALLQPVEENNGSNS